MTSSAVYVFKLISSVSTFSSSQPVPACSAQATSRPFISILSIHFGSPSFGPGVPRNPFRSISVANEMEYGELSI